MSETDPLSAADSPPSVHLRWSQGRVQWLCTGLGAWGVATGFAVFVLLWTHGRPHPVVFVTGLLVAALIAYFAELLRELIKEGVAIPTITGPRVIVTVLLLMIIELVVHAGTAMVQLSGDSHEAASTHSELQEILAPLGATDSGVMTEVVGLTVAWMVVGAVVARRLSQIVFLQLRGNRQGLLRGAREGVLGGLVAAPVCALACQMLVRGFNLVSDVVLRGDAWAAEVRSSLRHLSLDAGWIVALKLPAYLWLGAYEIVQWGHGAGGIVLAMLTGLAGIWAWHRRASPWVRLGTLAAILILLAPLPIEGGRLFHVALLAIVIWVVPGFMLGVAAPLLRGAGKEPRLWGLIAFGAAALLSLLTLLKFANPWCYALAFGLVLIGLLFFRGAPLREYWPLAAAAMASMVSGVMVVVEKATFLGVISEAHEIYRMPTVRPDPLLASMNALVNSLGQEDIFDDVALRKLSSRVRELANLPTDRQVEHLDEIKALLAQIQLWARSAEAGHLREIADGHLWGIISPGDDVAELYRNLARLVDHPPERNHREAAYGALLSQVDELIRAEKESTAKTTRWRAQITDDAAEIDAALRSGTASEDTARFGPALGSLVADLYQFSILPQEARGRQGESLRSRLETLMRNQRMPIPGDESDPLAQFGLPSLEPTPLEDRLSELWQQLARELASPGTGGFSPPKLFADDPAELSWRRSKATASPAGTEAIKLKTRLDWLQSARISIESQLAALTREQEPAAPVATASRVHGAEPDDEQKAHEVVAREKGSSPHATAKPAHQGTNFAIAVAFPSAARLSRLDQIRQKLTEVQVSAEELKRWWTAPPAVTLELSLVGSFGFWVTVALLAAWSLTEPRKPGESHG